MDTIKIHTYICTLHRFLPKNIMFTSFMYVMHIFSVERISSNGKINTGINAVTGRGKASVTQYVAIIKTTYAHFVSCKTKLHTYFIQNVVKAFIKNEQMTLFLIL